MVTSVKLKYVQQPVGKHAGTTTIIRPSKRIVYDTREAVVTFLSENVDTCVDEFLEEWAKVSKIVVLAREVAQMSKQKSWAGVQLISFDLQTVEFAYAKVCLSHFPRRLCCELMSSNRTTRSRLNVPTNFYRQVLLHMILAFPEFVGVWDGHWQLKAYLARMAWMMKIYSILMKMQSPF